MKKFIHLLAISALLSITFISCNKKVSSEKYKNSTISDYDAVTPSTEEFIEPAPVPAPMVVASPTIKRLTMPIPATPRDGGHGDIQSGILTAGDIDDNLNLSYFQGYVNRVLQSNRENIFPFMNTKGRVKITILGKDGKGMNRIKVKVGDFESYTNSQGVLYLFPSIDNISDKTEITINNRSEPIDISSKKEFTIKFNKNSTLPKTLDLMFVIDSTGSMGDEIQYLTKEFDAIVSNIENKNPNVDIRFGLVLYRDKGDDYVVRNFSFTSNAKKMKNQLSKQNANGGGDYPEAMEKGLAKALNASWKAEDGTRILFLVADAPPHDKNLKEMLPLIKKARAKGIRVYPIGASGVAEKAEYMMRHIALFTQGRYLWLTDDSGVGNGHAEPKVKCYQVTRLDQLISRVIESELSGRRVEPKQENIIRTVGSYANGVCQ